MLPLLPRAILTASLMIGSAEAMAETHTIGLVGQTCQTWTANPPFDGGLGLLYEQWILGFLSGVSYADPDHDPLHGMDAGTVASWIDSFCRDNRVAYVADAAVAFIRAHVPVAAPSPAPDAITAANASAPDGGTKATPPGPSPPAPAESGQARRPSSHAEPGLAHHASRRCARSGSGCPEPAIPTSSGHYRTRSAKNLQERPHGQAHPSSEASYRP
jgi:hypothetical protein